MSEMPAGVSLTIEAIYASYERERESFRIHLGASVIGRECERELWYSFRWCTRPDFSGRMLRLFETGRREETRFIEELHRIGIEVHERDPETGRQFSFTDFGAHFAGSIDAAALGIIEAPATWHVCEFKTFNSRRFDLLKRHGVRVVAPEHYSQVICYMSYLDFQRGFYLAVNKDSDTLYAERLHADPAHAALLREKARRIIAATSPPVRISEDPGWWKCKMCDHLAICHEGQPPEVHCRSCLHSTPVMVGEGGWRCEKHRQMLSKPEQERGCSDHLFVPDLLPGEVIDADDNSVEYCLADGTTFRNGRGGISSRQIQCHKPE